MSPGTRYPRSVTSLRINAVGLICLIACLLQISELGMPNRAFQVLLLLASWVVPIALLESIFLRRRSETRAVEWRKEGPDFSGRRTQLKLLGFYSTLLLIALIYWVLPEYHRSFFVPYWRFLRIIAFAVVVGAIPYMYVVDGYSRNPEDSCLHFGRFLLGTRREDDRAVLTQHLLLGWGVKAFFLPLMTVFVSRNLDFLEAFDYGLLFASFDTFFDFGIRFLFTLDLAIAGAGYLMTLRIFDAQIRSAEPTLLGWLSALLCYEPIWPMISVTYLSYDHDNYGWTTWLHSGEPVYWLWGSAILGLTALYTLCTATFGLRFSNLTHRGILTNGPYRYFKHPAYITKNLSWWLIAIPFIVNDGLLNSIRECLMLLMLNGVYWIRAWTEERHLSRDPIYRAYCEAVDHYGVIARLKRALGSVRM